MVVTLVERTGQVRAGSLVTLQLPNQAGWQVTTRVPGAITLAEGSLVGVELDARRMHLFEQASGRVLSHGQPEG